MTHLKAVREAVIKTNPEKFVVPANCLFHAGQKEQMCICERVGLADVLLALIENYETPQIGLGTGSDGQCLWTFFDKDKAEILWNLRKDSLDDQSPETITFLHSLLCQK